MLRAVSRPVVRAVQKSAVQVQVQAKPAARTFSKRANTKRNSKALVAVAAAAGTAVAAATLLSTSALASSDTAALPANPWVHETFPWVKEMDKAGIRRGFEVYRQVCSTCHSMEFFAFRHLVGVSHTMDQAKALAAAYEVKDGPDDKGEFYERPGRLSDKYPRPYPNGNFARYANNGALPPDLNCIVKGRPMGADYVFALLTGYRAPPHGIKVREGMYYNPYFAGGLIGMPPPLTDGQVEYEDGTEATVSQMSKDVVTFLAWASEPESDGRKKDAFKFLPPLLLLTAYGGYVKRFKWSVVKSAKNYWVDFSRPAKFH